MKLNPVDVSEVAARARAAMNRKRRKSPLEDALGSDDGGRMVKLVQWARQQYETYHWDLTTWRENRRRYAQEAQDVFAHRAGAGAVDGTGEPRLVFQLQNDSLNFVAGLTEFAAAQAEQDLFGGSPWFAAVPVGREDPGLADVIQKHLQWTFRDGRLLERYSEAITQAACLGEAFTKTWYEVETDRYEQELTVLHVDGVPMMVGGEHVTTEAQAAKVRVRGRRTWEPLYLDREVVMRHGVETTVLHAGDVAFREDAPELDLRYTNFYHLIELSVTEAMVKFHLSREDALRLAGAAGTRVTGACGGMRPMTVDAGGGGAAGREAEYGEAEEERLMNARVRLVEGFVRVDPFGDGEARRLYLVFPPHGEDWLVYADYLGNISPGGELPVKCHVWEPVPNKLYGRGFFAKYAAVQNRVDDLWNQVSYRNRMHANPVGGFHPERLERDDDEADLTLQPGEMLRLKGEWKLGDVLEFMRMPDLDNRSMELMQTGMQMAQLRCGINSASQGDLAAVPENQTATGIRQIMSRAAVLLKRPVRGLRRSFGRDFGYAVKLFYANFDRDEAFVWGEGETAELMRLTAAKVEALDIDVRMLLTQEQNQTKLEGARVAVELFGRWVGMPEVEKVNARPLFLQAMKALEFDQAEEIIRKGMPKLEDAAGLLPEAEQERLKRLLGLEAEGLPEEVEKREAGMTEAAKPGMPGEGAVPAGVEGLAEMRGVAGGGMVMPPAGAVM
ncbi:portal protein [Prosthecobacter algae]